MVSAIPLAAKRSGLPTPGLIKCRRVLKYLVPASHITVTTVAFLPRRRPMAMGATRLAPVDVPAKTASARASLRVMAIASSVDTVAMSSAMEGCQRGTTNRRRRPQCCERQLFPPKGRQTGAEEFCGRVSRPPAAGAAFARTLAELDTR